MPIIKVTLIEGYPPETIQGLSARITDAVRATMAAPSEAIIVTTEEVKPTNYMRGGRSRTPGPPAPSAVTVAREFLGLMEARDLPGAQALLGESFTMVFPSGKQMTDLQELIDWSRTRYQGVTKAFDGWDEAFDGDRAVVWARGTLSGKWLDGSAFEGIRFTDRFEVVAGKIVRQDVWNDMAEHRG